MNTTGKSNESWMITVPLTVFGLFVVVALGGPASFMNIAAQWLTDLGSYVLNLLKYL
jgi:hypothetical protein